MILVDVGVWLAAVWGGHLRNPVARQWLDDQADDLLLCRVTQMGLMRLISNPVILGDDAVSRRQAWQVVDELRSDSRIVWAEEPDQLDAVFRAISARADHSHKLWTDDYLAAFAQVHGAALATLDARFRDRYPSIRVIPLA